MQEGLTIALVNGKELNLPLGKDDSLHPIKLRYDFLRKV